MQDSSKNLMVEEMHFCVFRIALYSSIVENVNSGPYPLKEHGLFFGKKTLKSAISIAKYK